MLQPQIGFSAIISDCGHHASARAIHVVRILISYHCVEVAGRISGVATTD